MAEPTKDSILHTIFAKRQEALAQLNSNEAWRSGVRDRSSWPEQPPLRFRQAFTGANAKTHRVIAEIKRGSPSRGLFATNHQPVDIAKAYVAAGATALSVLTEPDFFSGSVSYIKAIRGELRDTPILMKDFFFDESQVYQARSVGADAILLIAAYLPADRIAALHSLAAELGLTTLLELHGQNELAKIPPSNLDSLMLGINTRDLTDLSISLDRFAPMADAVRQLPGLDRNEMAMPLIAESGIGEHQDLVKLAGEGADGFLVGSSLMATADPGAALAALLGEGK